MCLSKVYSLQVVITGMLIVLPNWCNYATWGQKRPVRKRGGSSVSRRVNEFYFSTAQQPNRASCQCRLATSTWNASLPQGTAQLSKNRDYVNLDCIFYSTYSKFIGWKVDCPLMTLCMQSLLLQGPRSWRSLESKVLHCMSPHNLPEGPEDSMCQLSNSTAENKSGPVVLMKTSK